VKHVQIAPLLPGENISSQLLLAEKETLEQLRPELSDGEFDFLQKSVQQDVKSFSFVRSAGITFIKIFKTEKNTPSAAEDARLAGAEALREILQYKLEQVAIRDVGSIPRALPVAEGMALASYQFLKYFSKPEKKHNSLATILLPETAAAPAAVTELNALVQAVFLARTLVNEPYSHFSSAELAAAALDAAQTYGFSAEVLSLEQIETLRMGGLLAVNKGSDTPPQFCILEWKPTTARNEKPVVLIGKGVVYDTGGLSLKPSEGMDYMKSDMAGAATVIGTFAAVAQNQLPVYLIGLIPITDNKIGNTAIAPGDVIRMASGKTVEVVNTDAEGRLILADALHYAKKYQPELALDFATLTGAAVRALGAQATCYMGSAKRKTKRRLEKCGWRAYERLVELPLWREYGEDLKSPVADLRNVGAGNAGMITAGKFLEHFTDYPWLHFDIAGPAYIRAANGYKTKEGTGIGVRLLYHFFKHYQSV
jgi:leucyl aminopeptidase